MKRRDIDSDLCGTLCLAFFDRTSLRRWGGKVGCVSCSHDVDGGTTNEPRRLACNGAESREAWMLIVFLEVPHVFRVYRVLRDETTSWCYRIVRA